MPAEEKKRRDREFLRFILGVASIEVLWLAALVGLTVWLVVHLD